MYKELLAQIDQPIVPILALIIFITCFVAHAYWTLKKENKKYYEKSSYMPLHDGVKHER